MAALKDSNKKIEFITGYYELALEAAQMTAKQVEALKEISNQVRLAAIANTSNVMCKISGTEDGFYKVLNASAVAVREVATGLVNTPALDSALRNRAKVAGDNLDTVLAMTKKDFEPVAIPEDGNEDWNDNRAAQVSDILGGIAAGRKNYILNLKALYNKCACEDIVSVYQTIGKSNEDACNSIATNINKLGNELSELNINIVALFSGVAEAAAAFNSGVQSVGGVPTGIMSGSSNI